uniref:Lipoprotein n=1 Tax=Streptomyces sp. NBC_01401 TaxID=2903854 RepID=A0AAU3GM42_9ACTN
MLHSSEPDPTNARHTVKRRAAGRTAPLLVLLLMAAAGCSSGSTAQDPEPTTADTPCPVTTVDAGSAVPTALDDMGDGHRWHGADDLWVDPPVAPGSVVRGDSSDSSDSDDSDDSDDGYRTKYASVTLDERGRMTDSAGPPKVSAERVDGSGTAHASTGGFATADKGDRLRRWWPTVIHFTDAGCWAVTEVLGPTTVRFVISVPTS